MSFSPPRAFGMLSFARPGGLGVRDLEPGERGECARRPRGEAWSAVVEMIKKRGDFCAEHGETHGLIDLNMDDSNLEETSYQ